MVNIKISNNKASNKQDSFIYFLKMILILAAIRAIPVRIIVKLVPGIKELSIPVRKSTIIKWFRPKTANGKANRILPIVVRFFMRLVISF